MRRKCHSRSHNNDAFDVHFLRYEYKRAERELPPWRFFDTLVWARRYRPDLPRHTLQFLREIYDIQANNAHRALDDVLVLHQVYEMMTDDLSIEAVHALLNQPRELRTMPFGKHRGQPLAKLPKTTSPGYLEAVPLTKQKIKPSKRLLQVSERFN